MKTDHLHGGDATAFVGFRVAVDVQQIIGIVLPVPFLAAKNPNCPWKRGKNSATVTPAGEQGQTVIDAGQATTENTMETVVVDLVGREGIVSHWEVELKVFSNL